LQVPIIKAIHDEQKGEVPNENDFPRLLSGITKGDWTDIKNNANKLRKAYIEVLTYIALGKEIETEPEKGAVSTSTNILDRREQEMAELGFEEIRFGDIYMKLPKDIDAIDTAKKLLDMFKERIEKKGD